MHSRIIAVQECSVGNAEAGLNWLETKVFDPSTPIEKIFAWRASLNASTLEKLLLIEERT